MKAQAETNIMGAVKRTGVWKQTTGDASNNNYYSRNQVFTETVFTSSVISVSWDYTCNCNFYRVIMTREGQLKKRSGCRRSTSSDSTLRLVVSQWFPRGYLSMLLRNFTMLTHNVTGGPTGPRALLTPVIFARHTTQQNKVVRFHLQKGFSGCSLRN